MLGDEIKAIESAESLRAAAQGEPVLVRVDGASFSRFTKPFERPFDARIAEAMDYAAAKGVSDFNCRLAYTQSDEITFLFWNPEDELPFAGRLQKLASRVAAKTTAAFIMKGLELFPERISRAVPEFDGRATVFPSLDIAAKAVLWREIDARRNAVSMAARSHFTAGDMNGKSSSDLKAMMTLEGTDFDAMPERFRRGAFFRRQVVERTLTPEEMSAIPEAHRPTGPVKRTAVTQVSLPPLTAVENLADVLFHQADSVVANRRFAETVYG